MATTTFPTDQQLPNNNAIIRQTDCTYSFQNEYVSFTMRFMGDTKEAVSLASNYRSGKRVLLSDLTDNFDELKNVLPTNQLELSGKVMASTISTKTGCGSTSITVQVPYKKKLSIRSGGGSSEEQTDAPEKRIITTWSEKSTDYEFPLKIYAGKGESASECNAGQFEAWEQMRTANIDLWKEFKYKFKPDDEKEEPKKLEGNTRKLAQKVYDGVESVRRAYPEVIRTTQYLNYDSKTADEVDDDLIKQITRKPPKLYYRDQTPEAVWKSLFEGFDWLKSAYDVNVEPTEYAELWNITVTECWMGCDKNKKGTWDDDLYGPNRWPFATKSQSKPQTDPPSEANGSGRVKPDTFTNQSDIKTIDLGTGFHAVDKDAFRAASTRGLRLLRSAPPGAPALESITMPSVSFIGNDAFNGAANLQSIVLSNQISFLGERVFKDCSAMTEAIVEPSIYELPASTFEGCSALDGSQGGTFTVGGLVNSLGEYAFKDCTALTAINCTNALTSIGANAFENDDALTSFTMGLNSTGSITIGNEAFKGCGALADIELPVPTITLGTDTFDGAFDDEVTVKAPKSFLTNLPVTSSYNYIYPAFVTTIAQEEFKDDTKLLSVIVPETVTSVGNGAFRAPNLASAVFSPSVTSTGTSTFEGCTELESLTVGGETLTTLALNFCKNCSSLSEVTITAPITQLNYSENSSNGVFKGCTSLTDIDFLPETVTSIGSYAFIGCTGLVSANLPPALTQLKRNTFDGCTSLKSAIMPENATGSLTLGDSVFNGCSALERVDLPVGTLTVGSNTFSNALASESWIKAPFNSNLVGSIPSGKLVNYIYPSFTTSLAQQEWMSNANIKSVAIPQGVTEIPYRAFRNCSNLQTATLPEGLTTIGEEAFSRSGLTEIALPSTLTTIAASGLNWCQNMTSITIPDSVTSAGDYFLFNNSSLSSIHIGAGMTSLGRECLAQTAIEDLVIPDNITTIGAQTCRDNTHLKTVVCGTGLHFTSYRMFYHCTALESVTFKAALNGSNSTTFEDCTNPNLEITCEQNTVAQVQGLTGYPFGLTTGQVIHCSDGDITI